MLMAELLLADGRFPAGGHAHSGGVEAAVAAGRVGGEESLEAFVLGRLATVGLTEAAMAVATWHRVSSMGTPPGSPRPLVGSLLPESGTRPRSAAGPDGAGRLVGTVTLESGSGSRTGSTPAGGATPMDGVAEDLAAVLGRLDAEAEARITAPPLRAASRRLGRQLLRVAGRCWPDPVVAVAAGVHPEGLHQPVALGAAGVAAGLDAAAVARLAVHHAVTTPAQAAVRLLGLDPFGVAALTARVVGGPVAMAVLTEAIATAAGPLEDLPARTAPLLDLDAVDHQRWDMRLFAT
jgi:urease accessory protein